MTNVNALKSKMALFGDTDFVKCLAALLHVSRTTASKKLNDELAFSQSDIIVITKKYGLSGDEIKEIFVGAESD